MLRDQTQDSEGCRKSPSVERVARGERRREVLCVAVRRRREGRCEGAGIRAERGESQIQQSLGMKGKSCLCKSTRQLSRRGECDEEGPGGIEPHLERQTTASPESHTSRDEKDREEREKRRE